MSDDSVHVPESVIAAFAQMEAWRLRALEVAKGPPHFTRVPEWELATVALSKTNRDVAILRWPHIFGEDELYISSQEFKFPARLLLVSEGEFAAYQADARSKYEAEVELYQRDKARSVEADERRALAILKAKYEEPAAR